MPANKKPAKKYRPRPMISDPVKYVLSGFDPLTSNDQVRLKIINHGAMAKLNDATATRTDWDLICAALNMARVMAEQGLGTEYVPEIDAAMAAHASAGRRSVRWDKMRYEGTELAQVNAAIDVHDAQLEAATVGELERAHMEVAKRIRNRHFKHRVMDTELKGTDK